MKVNITNKWGYP